jgi:hypothetical protein
MNLRRLTASKPHLGGISSMWSGQIDDLAYFGTSPARNWWRWFVASAWLLFLLTTSPGIQQLVQIVIGDIVSLEEYAKPKVGIHTRLIL